MNQDYIFELTGYCGGGILGICLLPQLFKTYKTKSTKDISYPWIFLYSLGMFFMLSYGLYFQLWPSFIPGAIEFVMVICLLCMKIYYESHQPEIYYHINDIL